MSAMVTVGLLDSLVHPMDRGVCVTLFRPLHQITSEELGFLLWFVD